MTRLRYALAALVVTAAPCAPAFAAQPTQAEALATATAKIGQRLWLKTGISVCPEPQTVPSLACDSIRQGQTITLRDARADAFGRDYFLVDGGGKSGWVQGYVLLLGSRDAGKVEAERRDCDRRGGASIGMSADQVLKSCWGKPASVNATITASGRHEQWVYRGNQYLYIDNGVVASIQVSR